MATKEFLYTNKDEDIAITKAVTLSDDAKMLYTVELLYTNIPNVVVKLTRDGYDGDETREILYVATISEERAGDERVVGRGPVITFDHRGISIRWSSGNAKSLKALDDEIRVMRLAAFMALEMELLHSAS